LTCFWGSLPCVATQKGNSRQDINRAAARAGSRQGIPEGHYVADHRSTLDTRPGQPQTNKRKCWYPTRASELDHRRLQVPPSPLHDPSRIRLHADARGDGLSCALCLTRDIRAFRDSECPRVITGHIDFLQVRNGAVHILDYKPDARAPTSQSRSSTIYALALTRLVPGLKLFDIKCAWFNDEEYCEFFPRTLFARCTGQSPPRKSIRPRRCFEFI